MPNRVFSRLRSEPFLWSALLIAAVVYALISFVNHYCFRTYALDLGVYTNALYDYAHFSWNDSSSFRAVPENLLADHFDLYLPLISPLSWIFGTYTLLVVQLVAVLIGATGVYRYCTFRFPGTRANRFALVYFLLFFGIFAAFSFDYHSNVVATMIVPWLLLAFHRKQLRRIVVLSLLFLVAKENMALWLIFIGFGMCFVHFKDRQLRYLALGISGLSVLYFIAITGYVMPALSNTGAYPHFHYSVLGKTAGEALAHLFAHPFDSIRTLFTNHSLFPANDYVKAELWIVAAVCGAFCLRKPVYLFMLIPVFAQKLFHDNVAMWGINQHYAVEFAPLFAIGTFETLAEIQRAKLRKTLSFVAVFLSLACAIRVMDNTVAYAEKARIRVYKSAHYNREFPVNEAYRIMDRIPDEAVVSAQSAFIPHLALRPSAYEFPIVRDAEYILVSPKENPYPLAAEAFAKKTDSLVNSSAWRVVVSDSSFLLLKKEHP